MADINLGVGGANSAVAGGYDIANSVKLEPDNAEFLKRNQADGNRKTWTYSMWVKRTELGMSNGMSLFYAGVYHQATRIFFSGGTDKLHIDLASEATTQYRWITKGVFRDTSAWYHFVWRIDTTQSTATDRMRMYVNGVLLTADDFQQTATFPQNTNTTANKSSLGGQQQMAIGNFSWANNDGIYAGYAAQCALVDGESLAPTEFGEFDEDTGIWKPKDISDLNYGTGNNSFFLDFEISSDLGANAKGNDANFTANNITSANQATDTPTNNFCTFNIITAIGTSTYTEGGTVAQANKVNDLGEGTMMFSSGNWYFEMQVPSSSFSSDAMFGFGVPNEWGLSGGNPGNDYKSFAAHTLGRWYYNNNGHTSTDSSAAFAKGDIVSIAINTSSQKAWVAVNGTWATGTNPATGTGGFSYGTLITNWESGDYLVPAFRTHLTSGSKSNANFGGYTAMSIASGNTDENGYGNFEYAPPSGYYALCTKNLAEYG